MTHLIVTAAIVEREGRFLVTRRPAGTHLAGVWEFPGGKCEPGESLRDCMARELDEELGVTATIGDEVFTVTHRYADRIVELHFLACVITGDPVARLGQEMRWVDREMLGALEFPPADAALIQRLTGAPASGNDTTSASAPSTETRVPGSMKSRCT
jgi:8-oxo-dGTP diphosphatase